MDFSSRPRHRDAEAGPTSLAPAFSNFYSTSLPSSRSPSRGGLLNGRRLMFLAVFAGLVLMFLYIRQSSEDSPSSRVALELDEPEAEVTPRPKGKPGVKKPKNPKVDEEYKGFNNNFQRDKDAETKDGDKNAHLDEKLRDAGKNNDGLSETEREIEFRKEDHRLTGGPVKEIPPERKDDAFANRLEDEEFDEAKKAKEDKVKISLSDSTVKAEADAAKNKDSPRVAPNTVTFEVPVAKAKKPAANKMPIVVGKSGSAELELPPQIPFSTILPFREFLSYSSSEGCKIPQVEPDPFMRLNSTGDQSYATLGDVFPRFQWAPNVRTFSRIVKGKLIIDCASPAHYTFNATTNYDNTAPEDAFKYSAPVDLDSSVVVVHCWCTFAEERVSYRNWHLNVGFNPKALETAKSRHSVSKKTSKTPHVEFILLDALAHANFRRGMPRTLDLFEALDKSGLYRVFEFNVYHVVGWHSDRNTSPLIMGTYETDLRNEIIRYKEADKVPNPPSCNQSLWGYFEENGYLTMYGDGECHVWPLGPMRYTNLGFSEVACKRRVEDLVDFLPPKSVGCGRLGGSDFRIDVHHRHIEPFLDYSREIAQTYSDYPLLSVQYLFESHMSTMGGFIKQEVDPRLEAALRRKIASGSFAETVTVVAADHGLHFGPHLETHEGQTEHKLPTLFMIFPKAWLNDHKGAEEALEHNQNALVTAFDVHRTIKHLLTYPKPAPDTKYRNSSPALSLLEKVPPTRNCDDAGINPELCVCDDVGWDHFNTTGPYDNSTQLALATAVEFFNNNSKKIGDPCVPIEIESIQMLRRKAYWKGWNKQYNQGSVYKFQFFAKPKSKGRRDFPLIEASIWQRASGSWLNQAVFTGEMDVNYVHRLTGATDDEIKTGTKKAEFCIIP